MPVIEIKDRQLLNNFISRQPDGSLFQTWEWGEFQQAAGFKIWRLGIIEGEELTAAATVLKYDMPGNRWYLYAPRFIQNVKRKTQNAKLLENIKEIGRKENCLFFRFDSLIADSADKSWLKELGAVKAPKEIQPRNTIMVDLAPAEDNVLAQMKSKWRYNIRLAEKKGVTVRESIAADDLDEFYRLAEITARRDKFHIHEKGYYQSLLKILGPAGYAKLFIAEYRQKVLAAILVSFYRETATYMHGVSGNEERNLMAPHLLQWRAMQAAKHNGCRKYDLYGVAPAGVVDHPWSGITRYKEGFGGQRVDYIGAYDIVYRLFWYQAMKMAMKVTRNK